MLKVPVSIRGMSPGPDGITPHGQRGHNADGKGTGTEVTHIRTQSAAHLSPPKDFKSVSESCFSYQFMRKDECPDNFNEGDATSFDFN